MAGTIHGNATDAGDSAAEAALAASVKDGLEHRLVVGAVVDDLRVGVDITSVRGPDVARLATVSHLATTIAGTVEPRSASSALELALRLHPTPAVAGIGATPRWPCSKTSRPSTAAGARGRSDGSARTRTANGQSPFVAPSSTGPARLVAGAGVVAGSDPDAEWAETQAKLEPMLRVLVQP